MTLEERRRRYIDEAAAALSPHTFSRNQDVETNQAQIASNEQYADDEYYCGALELLGLLPLSPSGVDAPSHDQPSHLAPPILAEASIFTPVCEDITADETQLYTLNFRSGEDLSPNANESSIHKEDIQNDLQSPQTFSTPQTFSRSSANEMIADSSTTQFWTPSDISTPNQITTASGQSTTVDEESTFGNMIPMENSLPELANVGPTVADFSDSLFSTSPRTRRSRSYGIEGVSRNDGLRNLLTCKPAVSPKETQSTMAGESQDYLSSNGEANAYKRQMPDDEDESLLSILKTGRNRPAFRRTKIEESTPDALAETPLPVMKSVPGVSARKRKHVLTEENFEPINTWWEKPPNARGKVLPWTYLEHNGLIFHPGYTAHEIPMKYNNEEVSLPPPAEEIANFWCAALTSDYPEKMKFVNNFWSAFLSTLPSDHKLFSLSSVPEFEQADFTDIRNFLDEQKVRLQQRRKDMTKDEREAEKIKKLKVEGPYMYALHDSIRERVASYKAEVPGLFRGRGEHPKMGKLKRRILPDEVVLNLAEDAPVPRLPEWLRGHCWQDVYHDPSVTWLAFYRDTVNSQFKYVFLGASSAVKGIKDYMKYELARSLKNCIHDIRTDYRAKMLYPETWEKQLGTAAYLIDALALRIGNEKDREEEADTVGCCSLRVQHITAFDDEGCEITLDFLGKDSIRYLNTVKLDPLAYQNMKTFCLNKDPEENIFDKVTTGAMNRYLRDLMPGLSAKVFRTYNASITLQSQLQQNLEGTDFSNIEQCKVFYEHANRQVAILCNHQRSVPKAHDASMEKLQSQLAGMAQDIQILEDFIETTNSGETYVLPEWVTKPPMKGAMRLDSASRKLAQLRNRKEIMEVRTKMKEDNKTVSNNTSKQHYMDPRITVTFCKKYDLPIEKFFNASLLKKFPWAMYAKSDFVW